MRFLDSFDETEGAFTDFGRAGIRECVEEECFRFRVLERIQELGLHLAVAAYPQGVELETGHARQETGQGVGGARSAGAVGETGAVQHYIVGKRLFAGKQGAAFGNSHLGGTYFAEIREVYHAFFLARGHIGNQFAYLVFIVALRDCGSPCPKPATVFFDVKVESSVATVCAPSSAYDGLHVDSLRIGLERNDYARALLEQVDVFLDPTPVFAEVHALVGLRCIREDFSGDCEAGGFCINEILPLQGRQCHENGGDQNE